MIDVLHICCTSITWSTTKQQKWEIINKYNKIYISIELCWVKKLSLKVICGSFHNTDIIDQWLTVRKEKEWKKWLHKATMSVLGSDGVLCS
jgi:hypothetical protein